MKPFPTRRCGDKRATKSTRAAGRCDRGSSRHAAIDVIARQGIAKVIAEQMLKKCFISFGDQTYVGNVKSILLHFLE
jgi:hypothetical protein